MVYQVKFSMDNSKYFQVNSIKVVDTTEKMYDLGTEALFVDVNNHSKITHRISSSACSDIKQTSSEEMEVYMTFTEELPEEMINAVNKKELFFSEC